jgi:hypothetical protein
MKNINLIPAPRLAAKRRRLHLRRCAAGCAVWAVLSAGAALAAHAVWRGEDPQAAERLARVSHEMEQTERGTAEAKARLAAAQSTLRANQAIVAQPDWSIVLALMGKQVRNDVVLKNCAVRPANAARGTLTAPQRPDGRRVRSQGEPSSAPPAPEGTPYVLEAAGLADSHAAANQFILRLEQTGLFSKVTLLDTAREAFLDGNRVAFRVECTFDQSPPREPSGTSTASGSDSP